MLIVDSQAHIWGANTPERPWPKRAEPHRATPIDREELLQEMDAAGVNRVVIVPWLTREDKEWIMGLGVCEWLGWPMKP
jgi:predicted TIM-barrel fold metal-dependent hydrolase